MLGAVLTDAVSFAQAAPADISGVTVTAKNQRRQVDQMEVPRWPALRPGCGN